MNRKPGIRCQRYRDCMYASMLLLLLLPFPLLQAQPGGQIVPHPNAKQLEPVWRKDGPTALVGSYANGAGGVGDVNGDGLGDFAIYNTIQLRWEVYYGGIPAPDTVADWHADSTLPIPSSPVLGSFYGDGRRQVGFGRRVLNESHSAFFYKLLMYDTANGGLQDAPSVVFDPNATLQGIHQVGEPRSQAVDLNKDGADELVLILTGRSIDGVRSERAEYWIFAGGSGFQLDSPTVVIQDYEPNLNSSYWAELGDIDGDGNVDVVARGQFEGGIWKLKLYRGTGDISQPWPAVPDYEVVLDNSFPNVSVLSPTLADCDGDGIKDIFFSGAYLYRSRTGKNAFNRSYKRIDADYQWAAGFPFNAGYMNDPAGRYEGVILGDKYFSGGGTGPDSSYEAYYFDVLAPVFNHGGPCGDVNGDGWEDYVAANPSYPSVGTPIGVAIVLSGMGDIPLPDTATSGVRVVAGEGLGIRMWPNPVRDRLTVTWRGDMPRPPVRMEIYNGIGEQIASAALAGWHGAAEWQCGDTPAGMYVVRLLDARGTPLAVETIIKK